MNSYTFLLKVVFFHMTYVIIGERLLAFKCDWSLFYIIKNKFFYWKLLIHNYQLIHISMKNVCRNIILKWLPILSYKIVT
jgi:hypothetical protein